MNHGRSPIIQTAKIFAAMTLSTAIAYTQTTSGTPPNTTDTQRITAPSQQAEQTGTGMQQKSEKTGGEQGEKVSPSEQQQKANEATKSDITTTVKEVYRAGHEDDKSAGINDIIIVKVRGLKSLTERAKCLDGEKPKDCKEQKIALFLDGRKIDGIAPESGAPRPEIGTLQFHLQRTIDTNDEAWADLLGAPYPGKKFFKRPTEISVGLENGYPEATEVGPANFSITRIREERFWICTVGLLILLYLVLRLGRRSDILRDSGPTAPGKLKPFSLARCQMAFWFLLVMVSFVYIFSITGAYDIITPSVLGLIGIGAGTALGAAAIDAGKREELSGQLNNLKAEEKTLESELTALNSKMTATPPAANIVELQQTSGAKQTRLNIVKDQINNLTHATSPQESQGVINDLLTDATGVSFHRFQMVTWTIVLGIIFIYSVWNRLSMPEFSATLLALMGISAGTYIGFKIPEKQS